MPNDNLRKDAGKIQFELIPPEWTFVLAQILTKGAKKYAEHGWLAGMDWSRMVGSGQRHRNKFILKGERFDPETGTHHLGQAAWNDLALMSYDLRVLGRNNLIPSNEDLYNGLMAEFDKAEIQ